MDGIVNAICCIEISVPQWWDSRCHERRYLWSPPRYLLRATFLPVRERERARGERHRARERESLRVAKVVPKCGTISRNRCGRSCKEVSVRNLWRNSWKISPFFLFSGIENIVQKLRSFCFASGGAGAGAGAGAWLTVKKWTWRQ